MSYLSSSDKVGRGNIDNNSFQLYDMYDNNILKNDTRQGRNKIKEIRKKKKPPCYLLSSPPLQT